MKTRSFTLLIVTSCFWLVYAPVLAQNDKEIAALKAAIEKETVSFLEVNKKDWEDAWLQTPYAYWSYSDSTGTSYIEGWTNIRKSFDDYFKTHVANRYIDVAQKDKKLSIDRIWKEFRIYGSGAFVQYTQKVRDGLGDRDETSQIRIMEKKDGKWKVVYVGIIAKYSSE
jgi:hypothetical protein